MNQVLLGFICRIIVITGVVFMVHILALHSFGLPLFNNKILLSYSASILLAMFVFLMLFFLRNKFKNELGYIFLMGSFIKLVFFIFLLYKPFYSDGQISKSEFLVFFVPYFFTHLTEIFSLSKWLNKI